MKELKNQIKTKNFKLCYLFYGIEEYLKKQYFLKLKDTLVPKESIVMNYDFFEDKKVPIQTIIDACETMPFLCEKRLVVVKNSGLFQQGRKNDTEQMLAYLSKIPQTTCIVFLEEEIDKRGKLYKTLEKHGHAVEFKIQGEKDLISWIVNVSKKRGVTISNATAAFFCRYVGSDMELLEKELEKLTTYKQSGMEIEKEDIIEICTASLETKIFDLVGALGNKKPEAALEIYHNLLMRKESPLMVLSMIVRQFRLILQCKYLQKEGSVSDIAKKMGQRDFVVRDCLKQANNFSLEQLKEGIENCLETDIHIKTGKIDAQTAIELLLIVYGKAAKV